MGFPINELVILEKPGERRWRCAVQRYGKLGKAMTVASTAILVLQLLTALGKDAPTEPFVVQGQADIPFVTRA